MHEIVRKFKAMLTQAHYLLTEWVQLVPTLRWASTLPIVIGYKAGSYTVAFGRQPGKPFVTLAARE